MSEEPIVTQLKGMIAFLKNDIEEDKKEIQMLLKSKMSFYFRFKINQQIRKSIQQIKHYEDKIYKYEHDSFT